MSPQAPRIYSLFSGRTERAKEIECSLVGSLVLAGVKNIFVDSWTLRTLQILLSPYHANPDITLSLLLEITGNPNVGFNEEDIEGDFDPKKYDEAMQVSNSYKYDIFPIISCFTYGTHPLLCEGQRNTCRLWNTESFVMLLEKHYYYSDF